jgi:hypothetical protein
MIETPKQCAARVGIVSERTIRELIRRCEIEHVRIAGRVYLTEGAFERYVEKRKVKPCLEGTAEPNSTSVKIEACTTSSGLSEAAAASAALARQTLDGLRSTLQNGSKKGSVEPAQVIPLKFA